MRREYPLQDEAIEINIKPQRTISCQNGTGRENKMYWEIPRQARISAIWLKRPRHILRIFPK